MDTISNERVPYSGNPKHEHMLIIIENNNEYDDENIYDFHVLRIMKQSYYDSIAKYMDIYLHRENDETIIIKLTPYEEINDVDDVIFV